MRERRANGGAASVQLNAMRGWSFPLGRWLGVDVRIHTFFILLLGVCAAWANMLGLYRHARIWPVVA